MGDYEEIIQTSELTHTEYEALAKSQGREAGVGFYPLNTASKIVYYAGSGTYKVRDGVIGALTPYDTAAEAIQVALDALTVGRTWKEKIVLKGNLAVASDILVPRYSIIEILGKVTFSAGKGFYNSDAVAGNTAIEIHGGEIAGGSSNQVTMHGVTDFKLHDISFDVDTIGTVPIQLHLCNDVLINNIRGDFAGAGIQIAGCYRTKISNSLFLNSGDDAVVVSPHALAEPSAFITLANNGFYHPTTTAGAGIRFDSAIGPMTDLFVADCDFYNMDNFGVALSGSTLGSITRAKVTGCKFYAADRGGITVTDCSSVTIRDNDLYGCGTVAGYAAMQIVASAGNISAITVSDNTFNGCGSGDGVVDGSIYVNTAAKNVTRLRILKNDIWDSNKYGITFQGSVGTFTNCQIRENSFMGSIIGHIYGLPASFADVKLNEGYVTENRGTSTIANGATNSGNIAHGLNYTPVAGEFTIIGTEDPTTSVGTIWIGGIDATNFIVYVENDPGATGWDFSWAVRRV